jgi:hypothetical protein
MRFCCILSASRPSRVSETTVAMVWASAVAEKASLHEKAFDTSGAWVARWIGWAEAVALKIAFPYTSAWSLGTEVSFRQREESRFSGT